MKYCVFSIYCFFMLCFCLIVVVAFVYSCMSCYKLEAGCQSKFKSRTIQKNCTKQIKTMANQTNNVVSTNGSNDTRTTPLCRFIRFGFLDICMFVSFVVFFL